jgi:hypothetical protein
MSGRGRGGRGPGLVMDDFFFTRGRVSTVWLLKETAELTLPSRFIRVTGIFPCLLARTIISRKATVITIPLQRYPCIRIIEI